MSKYLPKRRTLTRRGSYTRGAFRKSQSTRKKIKMKRSKEKDLGKIMNKLMQGKKEGFY